MAVFQRTTRIDAPFRQVWDFHSTIDGLRRLTPMVVDLRVEDIRLPEDETGDILVEGTEIDLSLQPVPLAPRIHWTSVITEREEGEDEAFFTDEMQDGPMEAWRHTHSFTELGGQTVINDRVVFRTPYGNAIDTAAKVGMNAAFAYRHRRTREILGQA